MAQAPHDRPTKVDITLSRDSIAIRHEATFGPIGEEPCARFLSRVFGIAEVRSIAVDRKRGVATIRHQAHGSGLADLLERMARALRESTTSPGTVPLPDYALVGRFGLHRHGAALTTWEVVSDEPGRLKLRQESLRDDPIVANRVARELRLLPGVQFVKSGDGTGHLVVRYDPSSITARALLGRAESTLLEIAPRVVDSPHAVPATFGLANLSLGIAAVGEFLVPALLPISAGLLVATNLRTFRAARLQLREKRLGLPVLYLSIVAITLATGQFLASALMTWLFRYWHRRFRVELASERHRLLERTRWEPAMARLIVPSGAEVLVTVGRLKVGDRVMVDPGELVPADGFLVEGVGVVDERLILGRKGSLERNSATRSWPGRRSWTGRSESRSLGWAIGRGPP